ncbi:MAG TPA: hypothetical protein VFO19_07580 [Vicinamibacterales bacterium]|jgi:hypothetical protein|nr:hypothetical protein [Vicinamibacterales bacterium]
MGAPVKRLIARPRAALGLAVLSSLVIGAGGCDDVWLTAPSGTAITLFADTDAVAVNGTAEITAVLIEGGQSSDDAQSIVPGVGTPVHPGTVVSFSTTLGTIEPADVKTGGGGRAVVRFNAGGQAGTATIRAISGPASQTLELTIAAASGR